MDESKLFKIYFAPPHMYYEVVLVGVIFVEFVPWFNLCFFFDVVQITLIIIKQ